MRSRRDWGCRPSCALRWTARSNRDALKRNRGRAAPGWIHYETFALSLLSRALIRRAGARRPDEHLLAVRERDVAGVRAQRAVLRHEALHGHFRARGQRVACPAAAQ